ncbi:hypothetical protein Mal64_00950 [Pseudobythopirellula maris]|uniref:Uncharacterized protein n=1 Tax=Pseudobythopirellula maris TaxID=2527991 RepID=A0A5C5ZR63_9BACT|nr:hypothetical protein [Pseudobythopirellula maris]TWT89716.1 hypothetical protein Mal64_00950 [Pseudobythopirellula maris]
MHLPRLQWGNCYFLVAYLALRGRVNRLVALSTTHSVWPWHLVALTKQGHAIHLRAVLEHAENPLAPWWFLGRLEGVANSQLEAALQESGRRICWSLSTRWSIGMLLATVYGVMAIPWMVAWGLWPIAWSLSEAMRAWRIRSDRKLRIRAEADTEEEVIPATIPMPSLASMASTGDIGLLAAREEKAWRRDAA